MCKQWRVGGRSCLLCRSLRRLGRKELSAGRASDEGWVCFGERWGRGKETVDAGFVGGNKRSVAVGGCGLAVHAQNVRRDGAIYRKNILISNKTKKA